MLIRTYQRRGDKQDPAKPGLCFPADFPIDREGRIGSDLGISILLEHGRDIDCVKRRDKLLIGIRHSQYHRSSNVDKKMNGLGK